MYTFPSPFPDPSRLGGKISHSGSRVMGGKYRGQWQLDKGLRQCRGAPGQGHEGSRRSGSRRDYNLSDPVLESRGTCGHWHLKCGQSELRRAVSIRHTLGLSDFVKDCHCGLDCFCQKFRISSPNV